MNDTANTVIKVLSDIMAQKAQPPVEVNDETLNASFEVFGLDSMDRLDFAMGLEDAFGMVFVTSEMLKCKTLSDIIAFAERAKAS
jgi:acyl carrier protein